MYDGMSSDQSLDVCHPHPNAILARMGVCIIETHLRWKSGEWDNVSLDHLIEINRSPLVCAVRNGKTSLAPLTDDQQAKACLRGVLCVIFRWWLGVMLVNCS